MRKKSEFTIKFVQPILKSLIVILGGFLLAPTQLLTSFYLKHGAFRGAAIVIGALIVIFALFNMISISLKAIVEWRVSADRRR